MNEEQVRELTDEEADIALTFEEKLNKRFERLFIAKWNSSIRPFVMQQINEKIAEEALRLGRQLGEIHSSKGEL